MPAIPKNINPPSPTDSTSSLPSSWGSSSPPQLAGFGSPYQCIPLPGSYIINPALGVHEILPYHYDMSYPPSSITTRVPMPLTTWDEPAILPRSSTLTIVSSSLPWRVTITASSKGGHVTVRDVMDGLYRVLRTNVTASEFNRLPFSEEKRRVTSAYQRRYQRMPDLISFEKERVGGLKRVDFLGEKTTFKGLASTTEGGHVWKLVISSPT